MGLDVYVGTLTRYYSGEWETAIQQAARASGQTVIVVRPGASDEAKVDPAVIREAVEAWRGALSEHLAEYLPAPLSWSEADDEPYFTDKPAWDCFGALLAWAAHLEQPGLPKPATVDLESWTEDPAFKASLAPGFETRFPALLAQEELWLPGGFELAFGTDDLSGKAVSISSVEALLATLDAVNEASWQADARTIGEWRRAGAEFTADFETKARMGFAVMHSLANAAVAHQLPLKLDY